MSRLVSAGAVIYSQIDIISGGITRVPAVSVASLTLESFVNNSDLGLALVDGTSITDLNVVSGNLYFNEISGKPGFYSVRFFADRIAFWRLILKHAAFQKEFILEFDVVAAGALSGKSLNTGSGLVATFTKC